MTLSSNSAAPASRRHFITKHLAGFSTATSFPDPGAGMAALTLHAEPVRAVLGLQHQPLAVLPPVLRRRGRALPPAPVGALRAARGPLAPGRPLAVH